MGAFDGELYKLGYRFSYHEKQEEVPQEVLDRRKAVAEMHIAAMPCPGSCGSACANHHCPALRIHTLFAEFTAKTWHCSLERLFWS